LTARPEEKKSAVPYLQRKWNVNVTQCHLPQFGAASHAPTAEVLPSVSKLQGFGEASWCLESVMLRREIVGFTKFGDKRVNDLNLL